jgi:Ca2+-binding RTX toxin-like protein
LPRSILTRVVLHLPEPVARMSVPLFVMALLGGAAVAPASALAADSCRASAARETAPDEVVSEPVVANPPGSPCRTDSREAAGAEPVGSASVAFPRADTQRAPGIIAASSSVDGAEMPLGGVPVSVGAVDSTQIASCVDGVTVSSGSSSVDALVIAGTPVPIVEDDPVDYSVGAVRVRANQVVNGTRQALVLEDGTGRELVLGEASATGDACAGPADGGAGGDLGQICPRGADYDVERNLCIIHEEEAGGIDGVQEEIVVGRPYEGPRGGTLVSLDEVLKRVADGSLQDSPCLRGRGPEYVVLGTGAANRITGSNLRDRILGRHGADEISGGLGNDCIDGGAGNDGLTGDNGSDSLYGGPGRDRLSGSADGDRLYGQGGRDVLQGADGADRLWGGSGNDAVNGGSGTDRLVAGAGNDSINTGFGRDFVNSGAGRDAINAATAGAASVRILCGKGRDTLRINRNERRRHAGCETVYAIR